MQACVAPSDDVQRRDTDRFTGVCSRETFTDFLDELPERVAAGQNDVDHRRGDREFAAPCGVEHAFKLVREVLDGLEAKVTGTAFERVERSENPVQRVLVGGVFLQNQDAPTVCARPRQLNKIPNTPIG